MEVMDKEEIREWQVFENKGKKIFAIMHRPPIESPPLVIAMHGFASHKIGTGRSYVALAEALCEAGIACLRFDYRGSGDSEGQLSEMTLEDFISDGLKVTTHLEGEGFSQVGYFGSSLGGTLSILTAARHQGIRALATWAPVASGELWFRDFLAQHPEMQSLDPSEALATYRGVKLHPLFREQFGKMAAYKTIEELAKIPLLHFQGDKDEVLSLAHQHMFQKHRALSSASSRFVTYPETGHWLGYSKVLPQVIQETVDWFKNYL